MAFFDKLGETIVNVGKDATQKAKDLSGVAKLNLDIKAKEDFRDSIQNLEESIMKSIRQRAK